MVGSRIVTDTTHYLPREVVEREGHRRGLALRQLGRPHETARRSCRTSTPTTTTCARRGAADDLAAVGRRLPRRSTSRSSRPGDDIVSIHLSGGISGTVRAAEQARDDAGGARASRRSGSWSWTPRRRAAGSAWWRWRGRRGARRRRRRRAARTAARALRADLKTWFAVDTLEFLRRGGRIGAAQAYLGSALKIKPILTLGKEIEPIERVRTGRPRRRAAWTNTSRSASRTACDAFAIQHIQEPGRAEELVERGARDLRARAAVRVEIGPVIGTHVGPGLLGVSGVRVVAARGAHGLIARRARRAARPPCTTRPA